jgi:hypothetical protein
MQNTAQHPNRHGVKDNITVLGESAQPLGTQGFMFGRMFPKADSFPMVLRLSTCALLGERMTANPEVSRADSKIPAGYTYFGQFVDHDISMDTTKQEVEGDDSATDTVEPTDDNILSQGRSPSLDLDSLYGTTVGVRADLVSGALFHIDNTTPLAPGAFQGHSEKALPYDLPRRGPERKALIGDPRNDENLAVAQTHLMWLKFHNQIASTLTRQNPGTDPMMILSMARDLVTRHYQYIVLHDFLRRMIDAEVYDDIIVNGNRKVLTQGPAEIMFMPLEFSVAAYRHGHSMVREVYDWNLNFRADGEGRGTLAELFRFSRVSGDMRMLPNLPSNWIPDFRRLYDLADFDFPALSKSEAGQLNFAKSLDPYLAPTMASLPEINMMPEALRPPFSNLAALNLRRGSMRALPSGQDISRALPSVKMLTKKQMRDVIDSDFDQVMENLDMYERTPLWLYVLLEAKAVGKGDAMGPLGSTLLADVFRTLVLTSRTSILSPGHTWTPADAQEILGADSPLETIGHVLAWLDARAPIVDPLQDARIA